MLAKGRKNMFGNGAFFLPLEGVANEVLPEERTTGFLKAFVRVGVVGGWEIAEIRRFGERDGIWGVGCHCFSVLALSRVDE
jgi:hypothetical protein